MFINTLVLIGHATMIVCGIIAILSLLAILKIALVTAWRMIKGDDDPFEGFVDVSVAAGTAVGIAIITMLTLTSVIETMLPHYTG